MKFETFEAEFVRQNKQLKLILAVSIILLTSILALQVSDKKYFVLKNSNLVATRPLLTWACEAAFQSITRGLPEKDLIEDSIINELKRTSFKVSSDEVLSVLALQDNLCRIIVKGEGTIRSFLVNFKTNPQYPFYYKLSEINESEFNQKELTLTKEVK